MNSEREIKREFSKRLKKISQEKPVRQVEIAKHLDLPVTTISNWYRGAHMPDIVRAVALADFLGCSLDYLFRGKCVVEKKAEDLLQDFSKEMGAALDRGLDVERLKSICESLERELNTERKAHEVCKQKLANSLTLEACIEAIRNAGGTVLFPGK